MSDKERVLQHLKEYRTITPMDAIQLYGCLRLSARIWELKHEGHDITTEIVYDKDRFGEPCHYARYSYHGKS